MALPDVEDLEQPAALPSLEFTVTHQEVDLDVDLISRRITGRATLTIQPLIKELQRITLNCRQLDIKHVTVDGHVAKLVDYDDPGQHINPRKGYGLLQHHLIDGSLTDAVAEFPDGELKVTLPTKVKIKEMSEKEQEGLSLDTLNSQTMDFLTATGTLYRAIRLQIDYMISDGRDALHWVGLTDDDDRFPHMYTRHQVLPGDTPSFVFPCLDSLAARCTWRLAVRCPRTLGDLDKPAKKTEGADAAETTKGVAPSHRRSTANFTEDERALELAVVSSGYMEDSDAPGEADDNKRKWVFGCSTPTSAHFVGFTIGPFEQVDLSGFRESDQDEKLGESAVKLHAFCLPGRADEVRNTCQPLTLALDFFTELYGSYPFPTESTSHKLCFVDDLPQNVLDMASLSLVTPRLLFPPEIIDNMYENLRELVHALANQWLGVNIVPSSWNDHWVIVGGSWYMADSFMTKLAGRNEHRYRQRLAADRVIEMDLKRPSLYSLGPFVNISPSNLEFMNLKAPLILFILDNRIIKSSGRNGVSRMFWKLLLDAKTGKVTNNQISTHAFMRICERTGHVKLDTFFQQWVYGSGCPTFAISQRFNKKKLTVEMIITQRATAAHMDLKVEPSIFMREAKENEQEDLYAGEVQPVFTGPMTVRIIEMDGTPYEHIVEIRENLVKFDIPYNTKYKRLKQRKRQKEAATAGGGGGQADGEDAQDRSTIYRLGNIFPESDTAAMTAWKLRTWNDEDDKMMKEDFAEWVRIDKDFEWICRIMPSQPPWMYAAQLSQDNDVAAHMESIRFFSEKKHYMAPTFLVRTLMDSRYFHGVRVQAAEALAKYASADWDPDHVGLFHLQKAFTDLFCVPDSGVTRPNDFTDRAAYVLQCAIPRALAKIRDSDGKVPDEVRTFFIDKMKFNDNANNDFSDNYYVATLLACMAKTFNKAKEVNAISFDFGGGDSFEQETAQLGFQKIIIDELDRHRRIDEWIPSFQNLYTLTALDCATVMMKEKAIPRRYADIIKYTKVGNADQVRLKGFECLVELDAFRSSQMRAYFIYSFSSEPSPYMRDRLWEIIGRGFGVIATTAPPDTQASNVGLSFDENDVDRRQEAFARNTIEGALKAIKTQLADDVLLQNVLFEGLESLNVGFRDVQNLLVVCRMLYPTKDSLVFQRRLPRFWGVQKLGKGKLRFFETDKIRKKPLHKDEPVPPQVVKPEAPQAPLKLNLKLGVPKRPREETEEKPERIAGPGIKRQRTASPEIKRRESGVKRAREDHDDLPLAGLQDLKRQRLAAEEKNLSRASSPSVDSVVSAKADANAVPKPKLLFKAKTAANGTNGVATKPAQPKPAAPASQTSSQPRPFNPIVKLKFPRLKDKLRKYPRGKFGHRSKESKEAMLNANKDRSNHASSAPSPADASFKPSTKPPKPAPSQPNGKVSFKPSSTPTSGAVQKATPQPERKPSVTPGLANGVVNGHKEKKLDAATGEVKAPKIKLSFKKST